MYWPYKLSTLLVYDCPCETVRHIRSVSVVSVKGTVFPNSLIYFSHLFVEQNSSTLYRVYIIMFTCYEYCSSVFISFYHFCVDLNSFGDFLCQHTQGHRSHGGRGGSCLCCPNGAGAARGQQVALFD